MLGVVSVCPAPFSRDIWHWPEVSEADQFLSCLLYDLERKACPHINAFFVFVFSLISNAIIPS